MRMARQHMGAEVREGRPAHLSQQHDLRSLTDLVLPAVDGESAGQDVYARGQSSFHKLMGQQPDGLKSARTSASGLRRIGSVPQTAFLGKGDIDEQHVRVVVREGMED